jgi:hypothetical protein
VGLGRPDLTAPDVQLRRLVGTILPEFPAPGVQLGCLESLKSNQMSWSSGHRELEWYIYIPYQLVQSLVSSLEAFLSVLGCKTFSTSPRLSFMLNRILFATLDSFHE